MTALPKSAQRAPILVVGTGRCGTSLVAGCLHHMHVDMGTDFIEPNHTNPHGHFEDRQFHNLHLEVIAGTISTRVFLEAVRGIAKRKASPWGLKDPRIADLLPMYLALFPDPSIIHCTRPPRDVVHSMMRSYGWPEVTATEIEARRRSMLHAHLRDYDVLDVPFAERRGVVQTLSSWLGIRPTQRALDHVHV